MLFALALRTVETESKRQVWINLPCGAVAYNAKNVQAVRRETNGLPYGVTNVIHARPTRSGK